jgi:hypothetical protein
LTAIHEHFTAEIEDLAKHADDTTLGALMKLADGTLVEHDIAAAMLSLSKEQRAKLELLRSERGDLVKAAFSAKWCERLAAMESIQNLEDDKGLAEPLLILALRQPWEEMNLAAARIIAAKNYRSDELAEPLVDIWRRARLERWIFAEHYYMNPVWPFSEPWVFDTLRALVRVKSKGSVAALIDLLQRKDVNPPAGQDHTGRRIEIHTYTTEPESWLRRGVVVEALSATGDKSCIPRLLPLLSEDEVIIRVGLVEYGVTAARADWALMALVRLTEQDPNSYGFVYKKEGSLLGGMRDESYLYGFHTEAERKMAVAKFLAWWKKAKTQEPYNKL